MSALDTRLDAADAIELAELLGWLADWVDSDMLTLAMAITRLNNTELSDGWAFIQDLLTDLRRFSFLLGAGDELFGTNP